MDGRDPLPTVIYALRLLEAIAIYAHRSTVGSAAIQGGTREAQDRSRGCRGAHRRIPRPHRVRTCRRRRFRPVRGRHPRRQPRRRHHHRVGDGRRGRGAPRLRRGVRRGEPRCDRRGHSRAVGRRAQQDPDRHRRRHDTGCRHDGLDVDGRLRRRVRDRPRRDRHRGLLPRRRQHHRVRRARRRRAVVRRHPRALLPHRPRRRGRMGRGPDHVGRPEADGLGPPDRGRQRVGHPPARGRGLVPGLHVDAVVGRRGTDRRRRLDPRHPRDGGRTGVLPELLRRGPRRPERRLLIRRDGVGVRLGRLPDGRGGPLPARLPRTRRR